MPVVLSSALFSCSVLKCRYMQHSWRKVVRCRFTYSNLNVHVVVPAVDCTCSVQVTTVCQRMLKEREDQIREDYDKVLASKLAGT